MMKRRLVTYCILLFLCLIDIKVLAFNETPDFNPLLSFISAESSKQATDRLQLKGTDVKVNIHGSIAEVTVRQQFKNIDDETINGRYIFPAPAKVLVHGMQMKTSDRIFKAEVKEQKAAQEEFNRLKENGTNALLLKQEKPNLFSMNLVNIMPGETVDIELNYIELLTPTDMQYEFVYPTVSGPGYTDQSEPGFNIEVNISAGIPIQQVMCATHNIDTIFETDSRAKVFLKDPAKKEKNQNFVLNYRLAKQKMPTGLILSGGEDDNFLLLNEYVGSPGLKNISLKFTNLKTYDLEPSNIPDISTRRPVTILGKWKGEADGFIKVEGRMNRHNYSKTYRLVKKNSRDTNGALKHLWAGKRISRLSDYGADNGNPEITLEITDLALKYNILTENTPFLAYNDVIRKRVSPVDEIKESLPLPEGEPEPVRIAKVPEPGIYLLVLIMSAVVLTGSVRRKVVKVSSGSRRN